MTSNDKNFVRVLAAMGAIVTGVLLLVSAVVLAAQPPQTPVLVNQMVQPVVYQAPGGAEGYTVIEQNGEKVFIDNARLHGKLTTPTPFAK